MKKKCFKNFHAVLAGMSTAEPEPEIWPALYKYKLLYAAACICDTTWDVGSECTNHNYDHRKFRLSPRDALNAAGEPAASYK